MGLNVEFVGTLLFYLKHAFSEPLGFHSFLVGPGGTKGRIFFFKVRQPLLVKICFYTSLTYQKNEPGCRIMLEFQFSEGKNGQLCMACY